MPENREMILLNQALSIVERELKDIIIPVETVSVHQAFGRTIVEDQIARFDLPPFDKSAMDGFAIGIGDDREEYRVLETVPAGGIPTQRLETGTSVKVMTGAPVPPDTGKVVMVESVCQANGKIRIQSHSEMTNICHKGEDIKSGDIILRTPAVLDALKIANLISVGIIKVKVTSPVRVAILTTGNEIVDSPEKLESGKIMNSNGPMLETLCRKYSLDVITNIIVRDDKEATISAISRALDEVDIVVLSGGVSVGDFDFVAYAMEQAGLQLHFNSLAIKPGKPMTFATSNKGIAFGLPGNPVAVYLMFHLFVLYAARLITGHKIKTRYYGFPLSKNYNRRVAERMAFVPC